jgi:hypothetical protein
VTDQGFRAVGRASAAAFWLTRWTQTLGWQGWAALIGLLLIAFVVGVTVGRAYEWIRQALAGR